MALYAEGDLSGRVIGSAPRSVVRAGNLPHAATAVLLRDGSGRVYVHRRTDTKDVYPGAYDCFAGGVVAAGEQPADAARRELAEELGVRGAPLRELLRHWWDDEHTRYLAFVYDATWDGPVVHQPDEVAEGSWMTLAELRARLADPSWVFVPDGRAGLELLERRGHLEQPARVGRRTAAVAAAADVAAVLVFVVGGRRTHDEGSAVTGIVRVGGPFLAGLGGSWVAFRAWRRPVDTVRIGVPVWLGTLGAGVVLRRLSGGGGTPPTFVAVAGGLLGALLVGWRAAWWGTVGGRRRRPT